MLTVTGRSSGYKFSGAVKPFVGVMELASHYGISAIKPLIDIFELFSNTIVLPFKGGLNRFLGHHAGRETSVLSQKRMIDSRAAVEGWASSPERIQACIAHT